MSERVVITGYGCLTATGNSVEATWDAIRQEKSGLSPITRWDSQEWAYPLAGELKDFNPRKMIDDKKLLKVISRHDVIGLNAAKQAIDHSGLIGYRDGLSDAKAFNDRTGVYVGSPGNKFEQQYDFMPLFAKANRDMKVFAEELFSQVHPMWLLKILPNNVLAYTGIQYQFKGPNENITNHVVGGLQAIIEATHAIQAGVIDRAVVVSYDSAVEPQGVMYYAGLGVMSQTGVKPFDEARDGIVLAEGAGAIVLESLTAAKARKAKLYGEIKGGATTSEAAGVLSVSDTGDGVKRAMQSALKHADLTPEAIGMVTAHANGTAQSDRTEAMAINAVFDKEAVPVTGFKWSVGHTLSGAGVIEAILTIHALRANTVPGIPTLKKQANDCAGINVSCDIQPAWTQTGMVISRAFASLNTCLILSSDVE